MVRMMSRNAPRDGTIQLVEAAPNAVLPIGWRLRKQCAVTLPASEPEPDFAVVRGTVRTDLTRHPVVADVGLVLKVADSTLDADQDIKAPLCGHAGVPEYRIIKIPDRRIEVYTQPTGPVATPGYLNRTDFAPGQFVWLSLDGRSWRTCPSMTCCRKAVAAHTTKQRHSRRHLTRERREPVGPGSRAAALRTSAPMNWS